MEKNFSKIVLILVGDVVWTWFSKGFCGVDGKV